MFATSSPQISSHPILKHLDYPAATESDNQLEKRWKCESLGLDMRIRYSPQRLDYPAATESDNQLEKRWKCTLFHIMNSTVLTFSLSLDYPAATEADTNLEKRWKCEFFALPTLNIFTE